MIEEIAYFLLFIIVKNNKFYEYKIILVCLYVSVYGYVYVTLFKCYLQKVILNFFLWEINSKFDIPIKALLYMETALVII